MVAYLKLASEHDTYWAGGLLVDWSGDPLEFARSTRITMRTLARILMGGRTRGQLVGKLFAPALLDSFERTPELICLDEDTVLQSQVPLQLPLAVLAPPEVRVDRLRWKLLSLDVIDDEEESRAWWAPRESFERVETLVRQATPGRAWLRAEPFSRLQLALAEPVPESPDGAATPR